MFNVCRRGNASMSKVLSAVTTTSRLSSIRPSSLSAITRPSSTPRLEARFLHISSQLRNEAAAPRYSDGHENNTSNSKSNGKLITKFEELVEHGLVHPNVIKSITKMKIHTMTEVQTATINQGLSGEDIIAQARTGTGKTLGFLVPTVQNILRANPELAEGHSYSRARATDIKAIIISPTRELAEQIATEAAKLVYDTGLIVQVAVGGNSKREMLNKTRREGCHILVATPGRLNDLLEDQYSGVSAPGLTTLVLDEADRLLDDGFQIEIEDILSKLPKPAEVNRQTMLFSATMPKSVMHLVRRTLKPNFHFVQTVKEGDLATHEKVPQKLVTAAGVENTMPVLLELAKREIERAAKGEAPPFKAIVYCQSTVNVDLSHSIFDNLTTGGTFGKHILGQTEISQIHSKLTQQQRTKVADRFRHAKTAILFSTDVTARGMDFPNVTHVIQLGLPGNSETYVHRIGRTGRADKGGEGWIILGKHEIPDARRMLRGLPVHPDKSLETASVDMTMDAQLPVAVAETLQQIGEATKRVPRSMKSAAYLAALNHLRRAGQQVGSLNQWSRYGLGLEEPPMVSPSVASRLGLTRTPGMNIGQSSGGFGDEQDDRGYGRSGSSFGNDRRGGYGGARRFGGTPSRGGRGGRPGFGGGRGGRDDFQSAF